VSLTREGRDMSRLVAFFIIAAASLSSVVWFAPDVVSPLKEADAAPSAAVPSEIVVPETALVANKTTRRILALDQAKRLAFWTLVLKSKKQTCDSVVRASYRGGVESGLDYWSVSCQDGNEYSLSVEPDATDSVCIGRAFDRSAW
jgi:hypothetical protein